MDGVVVVVIVLCFDCEEEVFNEVSLEELYESGIGLDFFVFFFVIV